MGPDPLIAEQAGQEEQGLFHDAAFCRDSVGLRRNCA